MPKEPLKGWLLAEKYQNGKIYTMDYPLFRTRREADEELASFNEEERSFVVLLRVSEVKDV